MKLNENGFLAKYLRKNVETEKRKNRERPPTPFLNEKRQMWFFLMNQIDREAPENPEEKSGK